MRIISFVSLPPAPFTSDPHSPAPASHDIANGAKDNRQHHKSQGRYRDRPGKPLQPGPRIAAADLRVARLSRSEEHTSKLQSLMRISYAVFCVKKKKQ